MCGGGGGVTSKAAAGGYHLQLQVMMDCGLHVSIGDSRSLAGHDRCGEEQAVITYAACLWLAHSISLSGGGDQLLVEPGCSWWQCFLQLCTSTISFSTVQC